MGNGRVPSGKMSNETGGQVERHMPAPNMDGARPTSHMVGATAGVAMPTSAMHLGSGEDCGRERVLVELRVPPGVEAGAFARSMRLPDLTVDPNFDPVPMKKSGAPASGEGLVAEGKTEETVVVRALLAPDQRAALERDPNVVKVWTDGPIAPVD